MSSLTVCATPPLATSNCPALALPSPEKLAILIDRTQCITQLLQIHAALLRHGLHQHHVLNFKLQRSYSSLGYLKNSVNVFDLIPNPNIYDWTSIIHCHVQFGFYDKALLYFIKMLEGGIEPNVYTFSSVLKGCSIRSGKMIHGQVIKLGLDSDLYVKTGMVDFYAKGGDVVSARKLFDKMSERNLICLTAMMTCYAKHGALNDARALFDDMAEKDIVCWNVMIDGYAQHGMPNEALVLFRKMFGVKMRPNEVTLLSVLAACGQLGALELGRWLHSHILNIDIKINAHLGSALIDMYSKCGSLEDAQAVFENMCESKDIVTWNTMLMAYAVHGFSEDALTTFDRLCRDGLIPNDITFIGALTACGHTGLVSKGWSLFKEMKDTYGVEPKIEHYGCMVNLLSRAGLLDEAYDFVKNMEIEPDEVIWGTLLGACKQHSRTALGEKIVHLLIGQSKANCGTYTLLSNIYAAIGNWDGVARIRTLMKSNGVTKEKGCSSIEVDNQVHEFLAGDMRHPKSKEIYMMLDEINSWLGDHHYVPRTDTVLYDIEEQQKEQLLAVHSERLAIAFGLISTRPGTTIRVVKNLRVCSDCHAVNKLISLVTGRKIVIRDRNRFHHFENGSCSCGDYW